MANKANLELVKFQKGRYITIEAKDSKSTFYFIKEGKVKLTREETLVEEEHTELEPGDFFGVVSCMSGRPRIDSAFAMTDVTLLAVKKTEFKNLIRNNAPVAMKILRYFSKRLRYYDKKLAEFNKDKNEQEMDEFDPSKLFNLGEYYNSQRMYNLALYAFIRYTQYAKDGEFAAEAKKRIASIAPYAKDAMNPQNSPDAMIKTFKDSTFIFCEGEIGNELYIIKDGKVRITKISEGNEVLIALLPAGEIFGEMAILDKKPRSACAISDGEISLMCVNDENFEEIVKNEPELGLKLLTKLSERVWVIYKQLANVSLSDPVGKLLDMMLIQLQTKNIKIAKNATYTFDFTPVELAKMVGLQQKDAKDSINKILENRKYTLTDEKKIMLHDLEQLEKDVAFYRNKEKRDARAKKAKENR